MYTDQFSFRQVYQLSLEIMPNSYSNILKLEQAYFKVYYDNM